MKTRIIGLYSLGVYTLIASFLPALNWYYYQYGRLPKQRLLFALIIFLIAYALLLFLWLLVIRIKGAYLVMWNPLNPFKPKLNVDIDSISLIKYAKIKGRWSFNIVQIYYSDANGLNKMAQFDTFMFRFDIERLERILNGKVTVVICDDY